MRCSSFCTADSYQIDDFAKYLRSEGYEPKFYDDVIHIQTSEDEEKSDIFFFPYGCIIAWGLDEEGERQMAELVKRFESAPLANVADDYCTYLIGDATAINEEEDEIILETDDALIKLSLSHGLSQSVKLTTFEDAILKTIESTRHIPRELAERGKIALSRKKLSQQIGTLFAQRNSINLHTDILDTPEFFWRRPKYEPYYLMAAQYMDIQTRMEILNKRLDVIHDLYGILSNEANHMHTARLELVIIILIMIEVVIIVFKEILKLL